MAGHTKLLKAERILTERNESEGEVTAAVTSDLPLHLNYQTRWPKPCPINIMALITMLHFCEAQLLPKQIMAPWNHYQRIVLLIRRLSD